jgi:hypothetical protein
MQQKTAAVGGKGNDSSLERTLADLAHAHILENAPGLAAHELGFQLLDRNEDDSRAVGLMGFSGGGELLYVPVFFLSGRIKGHELLYRQSKDRFVPCKEDWVNKLLGRGVRTLGEPVSRSSYALGVRPPRLADLSTPSFGKGAAAEVAAADGIAPALVPGAAALARTLLGESAWPKPDLGGYLKKAGRRAIGTLLTWCAERPALAQAFARYHDLPALCGEALEHVKAAEAQGVLADWPAAGPAGRRPVLAPPAAPRPEVWTAADLAERPAKAAAALSAKEKEELLAEGVVVKDRRGEEQKAKAYRVDVGLNLINPDVAGVYHVLTRPGTLERCVVLPGPWTTKGRLAKVMVVPLEGAKEPFSAVSSEVWARPDGGDPVPAADGSAKTQEDFRGWFKGLAAADDLPVRGEEQWLLVGPDGECAGPFEVRATGAGYSGEAKVYKVWQPCGHDSFEGPWYHRRRPGFLFGSEARDGCGDDFVHLTGRPGALRATGSDLYVPAGFRRLGCGPGYGEGKKERFLLGRQSDLYAVLLKSGRRVDLAVRGYGDVGLTLNGRGLSDAGALKALVEDYGLGGDDARDMLREARAAKSASYLVKAAEGMYDLVASAPYGPPFPEPLTGTDPISNLATAIYPQSEEVPSGFPAPGQPPVYDPAQAGFPGGNLGGGPGGGGFPAPDPQAAQAVLGAAQSGQKELFDATALAALLKTNREDRLVADELPILRACLDALGKLLFKFYWHGEEWQDRIGKADMPALEDGLRNSFENLGDLVLELETKDVGAGLDDDAFVNIEDAAE